MSSPLPADAPSNTLMTTAFVTHQLNHTLTCSFDGVPRPTVTWRVNGTTILSGTDNYVISESGEFGSDLIILGTRLDNSGEYECEVSNLLGRDSKTASLTVQGEGGSLAWCQIKSPFLWPPVVV